MRWMLMIAVVIAISATALGQVSPWKAYELYSWQAADGGWNFCLLPSPSGVNITAEQVFGSKCRIRGVGDLERRIGTFPPETTVFWLDQFSGTGGEKSGKGGTLAYPPSKTVAEVKKVAVRHKIKLEMNSSTLAP